GAQKRGRRGDLVMAWMFRGGRPRAWRSPAEMSSVGSSPAQLFVPDFPACPVFGLIRNTPCRVMQQTNPLGATRALPRDFPRFAKLADWRKPATNRQVAGFSAARRLSQFCQDCR